MAYRVSITARAERDLEELYEAIRGEHSGLARKWYKGLRRAILSLERSPKRCPITRERRELRHLLYGRRPNVYRVIYRIVERRKEVEVLHIRHGAMREMRGEDRI